MCDTEHPKAEALSYHARETLTGQTLVASQDLLNLMYWLSDSQGLLKGGEIYHRETGDLVVRMAVV